ncbi:MAG: beta-lactamase family protein [Saprospiraceae bacterium]|nr:beta-lactamase family protein [Saprospiraceae bacterium]
MVVRLTICIHFLLALFPVANLEAQQINSGYAEIIAASEAYFREEVDSTKIIGITAAIIMDDSVIWSKGFGFADKKNGTPMTTHTVINIGSITKTFTSLSIMQLQERGLLNINLPLRTYLHSFRPKTIGIDLDAITVKSIITHRSGIQPDYMKNSDLETGKYTDVLGFINNTYITFPPGEVGLYSNAGYNILGSLVKEVSNKDYGDYVRENIFAPLGMTRTGFAMDSLMDRSKIYFNGEEVREYELRDIASGGIYSNIDDFTKYARGLLSAYYAEDSSLIKTSTIHDMFSLQNAEVPIESNKKGLGWFMFKNDSSFAVYHSGSAGFAHAKLLLIPGCKAAVMVMTNSAEGGSVAEEFCFNFLRRFNLSIPDLFPSPITGMIHEEITEAKVSKKLLAKHTGNYAQAYGYLKVYLERDQLRMKDGNTQYILKPLSENEFVPVEMMNNDSLVERTTRRLIFKKIGSSTFIFLRENKREFEYGLRLDNIDTSVWNSRVGTYEHFGYQMLVGDTKFKSLEIFISKDGVLMMKVTTFGSVRNIPLRVISNNYALTSGINAGFGAFNVQFRGRGKKSIVNFAGLTFKRTSSL